MIKKWPIIKREVYQHTKYRSIEDITFEMPDGKEAIFSIKNDGAAVAIFALDTEGQIILARQFRPGPGEILDEIPGGEVDEGESLLDAAKRELSEETGYESDEWIELKSPHECAYSNIQRTPFIALNCRPTGDQNLDEEEFIEVVLKSKREFISQLMNGDCTDPEVGWMALYHLGDIILKTP